MRTCVRVRVCVCVCVCVPLMNNMSAVIVSMQVSLFIPQHVWVSSVSTLCIMQGDADQKLRVHNAIIQNENVCVSLSV